MISDNKQSEYSPALDESTFLAIISDFDLTNGQEVEEARRTLDILKESAEAEDVESFDPSGSNRVDFNDADIGQGENDSGSAKSIPGWASNTDDTSLSQGMSSLDLENYSETDGDNEDKLYMGDLEKLDEDGKVSVLAGIFSSLKTFDVKWRLTKCNWDVSKAIDELMTESFLEESGGRRRGIEAFSESDLPLRTRKGKGKGKGNKRKDRIITSQLDGPTSEPPTGSPLSSKWDTAKQDIEFISTRTGTPSHQVKSIYHNNGASIRDTITAIVDAHIEMQIGSDDPIIQVKIVDLAHEFPTVSASKLEAIIQITHPSDAYAHELAKAIAPSTNKKSNIQIEIRHAPLQLDPVPTSTKPKAFNALYTDDTPLQEFSANVAKYTQSRDAAFQKASAMYRKGKSDHLMGGAAAYYSQQGRDADALARSAMSAAADALVAAHSSRFQVDLHGCNVNDAKRITQERVTTWWHELGQERPGGATSRSGSSLKIVTGRGIHSEGRAGKLGPAVGKMLIRDGWKIEVSSGFLTVTGIARTK